MGPILLRVQVRRDPDSTLDPSPLTNSMNQGEAQTFPKSQCPPFPDEIFQTLRTPLSRQHWAWPGLQSTVHHGQLLSSGAWARSQHSEGSVGLADRQE